MNWRGFLNRAYKIVSQPAEEWNVVVQENASEKTLFKTYALPWILLSVLTAALFNGIYADEFWTHFLLTLVIDTIAFFGGYFLTCYLGFYVASKVAANAFIKKDVTTLVTYSFTIYWVLEIIGSVVPEWMFAKCLNLFVAYLLWKANKIVVELPEQKLGKFVTILTVIILLSVPLIRKIATFLLPNLHV